MDYHDYVIKDGEFIGKFEEMYKECDDPWNQKRSVIQAHKMACMESIAMIRPKKVCEIGCGLGYLTDFYSRIFPDIEFRGMDISDTAIKKARERFGNLQFETGNIANVTDFSVMWGGVML